MKPVMTICVYFDDPNPMGVPFSEGHYYESYCYFSDYCSEQHVQLVFVRDPKSYLGKMKFAFGWKIVDKQLVAIPGPIQGDLIYMKGNHLRLDPGDITFNDHRLIEICNNKLLSYELFKRYSPVTMRCTSELCQDICREIPTDRVVVKPVFGLQGKHITIGSKAELPKVIPNKPAEPYMAQQFIDSSHGIPGVLHGLHDLRLHMYNGDMKLAYIRVPQPGKLLANIAQGGHIEPIRKKDIPSSALQLAEFVDTKLQQYGPRFYSVDVMFQDNTPYIIELNHEPGIPYPEEEKYDGLFSKFQKYLLQMFLLFKT